MSSSVPASVSPPPPPLPRSNPTVGPDGQPAIQRLGLRQHPLSDLYHFLLVSSWSRLIAILLGFYVVLNGLFAVGYYLDVGGVENLRAGSYLDAFFFSVQTMATIGYGKMSPVSTLAHALVTVEAITGLLAQAMATGLLFAKFSRPTARVMFSRNAVVSLREGMPTLMFRIANERSAQIAEAQVRVVLLRDAVTAEGERIRRVFDLKLARSSSAVFALSWTVLHPITPDSPLHGLDADALNGQRSQLIVSVVGMETTISQTVHTRHVYSDVDILWGMRFTDIFVTLPDGRPAIDFARFHEVMPAPQGEPARTP